MDEIDKQIVNFLGKDGRMKLVDIGASLKTERKEGYSHVGVKKRILKLLEQDLIRIQTALTPYRRFYSPDSQDTPVFDRSGASIVVGRCNRTDGNPSSINDF